MRQRGMNEELLVIGEPDSLPFLVVQHRQEAWRHGGMETWRHGGMESNRAGKSCLSTVRKQSSSSLFIFLGIYLSTTGYSQLHLLLFTLLYHLFLIAILLYSSSLGRRELPDRIPGTHQSG